MAYKSGVIEEVRGITPQKLGQLLAVIGLSGIGMLFVLYLDFIVLSMRLLFFGFLILLQTIILFNILKSPADELDKTLFLLRNLVNKNLDPNLLDTMRTVEYKEIVETIEDLRNSLIDFKGRLEIIFEALNSVKDQIFSSSSIIYKESTNAKTHSSRVYAEAVSQNETVVIAKQAISALSMGIDKVLSRISELSSSIHSIAKQTNLLAINASIEATKAGMYGKGFSVVAEQIRRLAEETKRQSLLITQTTTEFETDIGDVVEELNKLITNMSETQKAIVNTSTSLQEETSTIQDAASILEEKMNELDMLSISMKNEIERLIE